MPGTRIFSRALPISKLEGYHFAIDLKGSIGLSLTGLFATMSEGRFLSGCFSEDSGSLGDVSGSVGSVDGLADGPSDGSVPVSTGSSTFSPGRIVLEKSGFDSA